MQKLVICHARIDCYTKLPVDCIELSISSKPVAVLQCFLEAELAGQNMPPRQVVDVQGDVADEARAAAVQALHVVLVLQLCRCTRTYTHSTGLFDWTDCLQLASTDSLHHGTPRMYVHMYVPLA